MKSKMYVFIDKETGEVADAGDYESEEEALNDFHNWDEPRNRYMINNETGERWD